MTNPPTPQMPKPDFTRLLSQGWPNTDHARFACWKIPATEQDHVRPPTTIEQFARDMMEERDQYRNAIQEGIAMSGGEFTGVPRKDINTIVRDQVALQKADRVEELEKLTVSSFDLLNDALVLLEGSTLHPRAMKLIQQMQRVYDQALTTPGEKGAEG